MGRKGSGEGLSDDTRESIRDSLGLGSPKDLKQNNKSIKRKSNDNSKPIVRSIEKLNTTINMNDSREQVVAGPSGVSCADISGGKFDSSNENIDNHMDFCSILPPPVDDVMEFINLDEYDENGCNKLTSRDKKRQNRNNRGSKRKHRLSTDEDSVDELVTEFGAVDKPSAEFDGISVDGIGRRAVEWIDSLESMRRRCKTINGKISGDMKNHFERLKYAMSLLAARSGAGGDPVFLTKNIMI